MGQVGVEGDAVPLAQAMALGVADQHHRSMLDERGLAAPGLVHRGVIGAPVAPPGASVWRESSARWPGCEEVITSNWCPRCLLPPRWRSFACTTVTEPASSRRRSWDSRSSSPAAMRVATVSVGLVSPRSTWESIGALTPLRTARSRSDSEEASRSAFTRAPMTTGSSGSGRAPAVAASRRGAGHGGIGLAAPLARLRVLDGHHTIVRYHRQARGCDHEQR